MALNLLDRRPYIRNNLFELDLFDYIGENNATSIESHHSTDITYYYRKKLYYLIKNLCFEEKLPQNTVKLIYETCVNCGRLVEIDTNRVKIGSLFDLNHLDPNLLYNLYGKNNQHEIFISCGTFFMGVLSHVSMNLDFDQPKIALIKQLNHISQEGVYRNFIGIKKDEKLLENLVESLQKSHIQIIFTSSPAPIFLSNLLAKSNITCIAHISPIDLNRLAQVTKSTLYTSLLDACEDAIQDQLGKLMILGEDRYKLIIASECDFRMGLSIFTNNILIPVLEKALAITFTLFSEELFIKSINGNILPKNGIDCDEFDRSDLTLELFGTRKLKLCGMHKHTFIDYINMDYTLSLKTWIKELLLNCTKFNCPFENSGCNGHLSEHILIFSNRKHNIEMSFIYNYKLLALPDSNFSTYIQLCCYNCGILTPNKPFNSSINLIKFLKTLLKFENFTHKCKENLEKSNPNHQEPNYLFLGNSKEIIFSLVSDDLKLTFPFKVSFKLLPFERYQFIPLVSDIISKNNIKYTQLYTNYFDDYPGNNLFLSYFKFYTEFNSGKKNEFPSLNLICSLHLLISKYISNKDSFDLHNLPCKCDLIGIKSQKSNHNIANSNPIDDWIINSNLGDDIHDHIKEIRDGNLVYSCNYNRRIINKCNDVYGSHECSFCIIKTHCTSCIWQYYSSYESLYIYNSMLLLKSITQDYKVDMNYLLESICELYIIQIIFVEFNLHFNELKFLTKLVLARYISRAKIIVNSPVDDPNLPLQLSKSNLIKIYNLISGINIDDFDGVYALTESSYDTSRADLGSILAKNYSNLSCFDFDYLSIFSVKNRNTSAKNSRRSIFCIKNTLLTNCNIFDFPPKTHESAISYGSKRFIIENFFIPQFSKLRNLYGITQSEFIKSICKLERKHSTGGKSGAPLYVTHDRKYVIKLLNNHEFECFIQNGLKLINYFSCNRNTLLCIPFGCIKINVLSPKTIFLNKTIKCIILQNVDLCNEYCNHNYGEKFSFDLKGVGLHRSNVENISSISESTDSISGSIDVNNKKGDSVLGIFDTKTIDATKEFLVNSVKTINVNSWNDLCVRNDYDLRDIVLWDRNFFEYTKGCPLEVDSALPDLILQIDEDIKLLSELNVVDYSLLLHIYPKSGRLCLSIIDYLRPYTWDKQVETIGKKLANITSGETPTILSPIEYMRRFHQQVEKLFSNGKNIEEKQLKIHFNKILSSLIEVEKSNSNPPIPFISTDVMRGDDDSRLYSNVFFMGHETSIQFNKFLIE